MAALGLARHHLLDELHERDDAGLVGHFPEKARQMDVVGAEVGEGTAAVVLELDPPRAPGGRAELRVTATKRLQLRLLVSRDHVVVRTERDAAEGALVQVEDSRRFGGKVGIAGEDPRPVLPGLDRRRVQPAAHRRGRDRLDQSFAHRLGGQLVRAPAREWHRPPLGRFAGERLDAGDDACAKAPWSSRASSVAQAAEPLLRKALAPLGGDVDAHSDASRDLDVLHAFRRQEHDPRPDDCGVRDRPRRRLLLEDGPFLRREPHFER